MLIGEEKWVIINIANEPYGNNVSADEWVNGHKTAISRLRSEGFSHLLMVDAANWGQDWSNTTRSRASEVLNADPKKNTIISVHMYDVYNDDAKVNSYLQAFVTANLPLCVGEFAADHGQGKPVAAQAILNRCKEYGIGYIGWSWKGNSSGLESLDIAQTWDGSSLTSWGNLLINGTNGIKATSVTASVFKESGTISPVFTPVYNRTLFSAAGFMLVNLHGSLIANVKEENREIKKASGMYIVASNRKIAMSERSNTFLYVSTNPSILSSIQQKK
ncbi:MAG: glycoside hydrolase family 5 protein [Chitinispirillaceae bacterium]|nr:glycoside hydrolase family 5 protein [Chitinispirillaceae bacterium]